PKTRKHGQCYRKIGNMWSLHQDYHDPFVAEIPPTREYQALKGRKSVTLTPDTIAGYDAVLVATDHDRVDYEALSKSAALII
ncbi:hypothetical protein ACC785_38195, partial [Rhizobium ruizarguesonis]